MMSAHELSFAALEDALETLALLQSMFPLNDELRLSSEATEALPELERQYEEGAGDRASVSGLDSLALTLNISLEEFEVPREQTLELDVQLSLRGELPQPPSLRLRQPEFLNRSQHEALSAELSSFLQDQTTSVGWTSSDLLLTSIDLLRESAGLAYKERQTVAEEKAEDEPEVLGPLQRTWFWFPSLSSKEKRQDFVDYSHEYKLTGFVMAGKPGLLCVEGNFPNADRFMSTIKSESWSDIPSFQKKVTERLRSPISKRAFTSMTDITDLIPKHGTYAHRGDMSEVKRLMESYGVGEDFGSVVLGA